MPSLSVAELEQAQAERDALAPFGESWSEDDGPMREWISHQSSLADVNCEFRGDYAAWWFDVYRTPPPPDCTSERRLLFAIASRREGVRLPPREQRKLDALALRLGPAPEVKRDQQTEALVAAHGLPAVLHSHLWELARRHRLFWWPGLFRRPAVPLPEDSRLWRANPQLWSDAEFEQLGRLPDGGVRFPGVYPAQPGGIPHAWDSAWCTEDNGVRQPYAEGGAGEVWPAEPFAGVGLPWKKACHELTLFHAPDELNIWAQVLDACEGEVVPVLYAAAFKPFWARPLASFALEGSPHDCVNRLLRHLFEEYPLTGARTKDPASLGAFLSLVLLGRGQNLELVRRLGWYLPAQAVRLLHDAPGECELERLWLWREVRLAGGGEWEFELVKRLADGGGVFSPLLTTEGQRLDLLRWLVAHPTLTDEQGNLLALWPVLRWAAHQGYGAAPFRWRGRSLDRLQRTAQEWEAQQAAARLAPGPEFWQSKGWDGAWESEPGAHWSVTELTTRMALAEEGVAMGHCVGNYARACGQGVSAIFTLRRNGERVLTVEVNPQSRSLVQTCGPANRKPTDAERALVLHWWREQVEKPASELPKPEDTIEANP